MASLLDGTDQHNIVDADKCPTHVCLLSKIGIPNNWG
jgi:hypothetical protein